MKRLGIAMLALALGLGACTSDEPDDVAAPSPSPSASASDEPSEPDDDPSPSASPSPSDDPSDGADGGDGGTDDGESDGEADAGGAGTDGGTADGGTTDDATTDGGTTDGGTTDADQGDDDRQGSGTQGGVPGGPASDTPGTAVAYDASGSPFAATTEHTRQADFSRACHVVPAAGETITECEPIYSDVNQAWFDVVEATDDNGATTVTLYRYDGDRFVSSHRAGAAGPDTFSLGESGWANAEDLAVVSSATQHALLAWDRAGDPRVVAQLPADAPVTYTAQRVVRRTSQRVEVLAVSDGDGLAGTSFPRGSEEDIGLTVYAAWVDGDRDAASGKATDEVLHELFERSPAPNDSYQLNGTSCGASGTRVACGFTARYAGGTATMTWTLGTVDGVLQVVHLDA